MRILLMLIFLLFTTDAFGRGHDWQSLEGPTEWERAWIEQALTCKAKDKYKDPHLLLKVLRMETHPDIRVPDYWRGMTLAAACNESRFSPAAKGDGGRSKGFFQIKMSRDDWNARQAKKWGEPIPKIRYRSHWGACNYFDRTNAVGNARCWLWRIRVTYDGKKKPGVPTARGRCGKKNGWPTAWVWIAVGPSPKGKMWQCWNRPPRGHQKRFKKWKPRVDKALANSGAYYCTAERCFVE